MFEREIKFIYDFNLNKVNKLGPYFTFEQLLGADLNPAILHYISAEINYLIFEDRQKLLKNSIFDYSNDVIAYHFSQISEEVKKTKRFALEYIGKLILHASSFTINYLARPKWTLAKFIFDEGDHKTTFEIKQILEYVYYYPYLKKILISYINKKKIISMNSDEFIELLNKVDRLGIDTYLPSILNNALKSMSEFYNIGEVQKSKVPLSAVELFLDEKQLHDHILKLKKSLGGDSNAKYEIQDYLRIFRSALVETPEIVEDVPVEENLPDTYEEPIEIPESDTEDDFTPDDKFESEEAAIISDIENTHKKLRIRIDQDNKIEQIEDEIEKPEEIQQEIFSLDELKSGDEEDEFSDIILEENETPDDEDATLDEHLPAPGEVPEEAVEEIKETESTENYFDEDEFTISDTHDDNTDEEIEHESFLKEETSFSDDQFDKTPVLDESSEKSNLTENPRWDSSFEEPVEEEEVEIRGLETQNTGNIPVGENIESEEFDTLTNIVNPEDEEFSDNNPEEELEVSYNKAPDFDTGGENSGSPKIEIADLLEHKDTTKIIEVVYDYDIEEFAATIDAVSNCSNLEDALVILNEALKNHHIERNSREAESFKAIISEYFNRK